MLPLTCQKHSLLVCGFKARFYTTENNIWQQLYKNVQQIIKMNISVHITAVPFPVVLHLMCQRVHWAQTLTDGMGVCANEMLKTAASSISR